VLVLSRRLSEKIVLPHLNITLLVVAIQPGVVRLGIEAPPDVPIVRAEVLDGGRAARATPPARRPARPFCPA
jgi:carbon storage regulator